MSDKAPEYQSVKALVEYYDCVKAYALKYTKTSAPANDVAEAALSACAKAGKSLYSASWAFLGSKDSADKSQMLAVDAARRWAIQSLLEARFPLEK